MTWGKATALTSAFAQPIADIQQARQGIATKNQEAKIIGQTATYNAQLAEQQAELARQRGALAEEESRYKSRLALGTIKARAGKSGVLFEGSPLHVYLESVKQAELDALYKRYGGELGAFEFNQKAGAERLQAGLTKRGIKFGTAQTRAKIPNIFLSGLIEGLSVLTTKPKP